MTRENDYSSLDTTRGLSIGEQTGARPSPARAEQQREVPVIRLSHLQKTYQLGQTSVQALRDVSLDIYPGELVAIMGPSGSGKSTLMNILGCLDRPSQGVYSLGGKAVSSMSADELAEVRNTHLGFVFQSFNLLSRISALKNVQLPLMYAGISNEEQELRARRTLQLVGLGQRLHHKPTELSGGQQQRVAIARAIVNHPSLLLADEPTGNLDSRTSLEIMAVLQELNGRGLTIVLVTHDAEVAQFAKRQVMFRDGSIRRDEIVARPRSAQVDWNTAMTVRGEAEKE